jgi:hypothetical protein
MKLLSRLRPTTVLLMTFTRFRLPAVFLFYTVYYRRRRTAAEAAGSGIMVLG